MKKISYLVLTAFLCLAFACSDSKETDNEESLDAERDYYEILMDVFAGSADLPDDFAAILDDSFPPRGLSPLLSFKSMDAPLINLWMFATSISDNGFSIIKPGMLGQKIYQVPGTDMEMEMEVEQFLMNVAIHTKAMMAVIDDEEDSDIRGILPDGMTINIVGADGTPYAINRDWIKENSYFSAYVLLARAYVIEVVVNDNSYPIPTNYESSRFEIFTYDNEGKVTNIFTKPSDLLYEISRLDYQNPTLTYKIKIEVKVPANLDGDFLFESDLYLPFEIYAKADISFPMLENYVSHTTEFTGDPKVMAEGCEFYDPTEGRMPDAPSEDPEVDHDDPMPSWWLPNIPPAVVEGLPVPQEQKDKLLATLFVDEGERNFDVDWWRDLEILTEVPGLGLSDVGFFDKYSGELGTEDLSQFNKNGVMDSAENRAVFFDRIFRMNGFRLTDMGNYQLEYPEDVPEGIMDSPKIDIDSQGNVTFGGKYDGPTRIVGVHTLADSIPPDLKILFLLKGLVPDGVKYDASGIEGFAKYVTNVKAYLPCSFYTGGWQEVNMYQLLQYIADKWNKIAFYSDYFDNADSPELGALIAWLTNLSTGGEILGRFPKVDLGELAMDRAPFILKADIKVPERGKTYEGVEILSSAFGGFYFTNFYSGATDGIGLGQ